MNNCFITIIRGLATTKTTTTEKKQKFKNRAHHEKQHTSTAPDKSTKFTTNLTIGIKEKQQKQKESCQVPWSACN